MIQGSNSNADHWDATRVQDFNPSPDFADQISDSSNPLYLDDSVDNTLLLFPRGTPSGIRSFAYAVGIRPQDLFGTCLAIYLSIVAATVVISSVIWFLDWIISSAVSKSSGAPPTRKPQAKSPRYSAQSESAITKDGAESPRFKDMSLPDSLPPPQTHRLAVQSRKAWWNYRLGQSSFHRDILYGNLVRILILFHVPITLYSCFQFSLGRPDATVASLALAGLAFTFLSLLLPGLLLSRVSATSTGKLFEATRTLLSLGPLYYYYSPGQQRFAYLVFAHNLAFGIIVGAGQRSGTAQAIILLIIEILAALGTSMWLPWGEGAHMGALAFMFCVGRIITCVLLIILSPVVSTAVDMTCWPKTAPFFQVSVGSAAAGWIAYAILIVNGLIYMVFAIMLLVKLTEGIIRFVWKIPFDKSRRTSDAGLLGVLGFLPWSKRSKRRRSRQHRSRPSHTSRESDVRASMMFDQLDRPQGPYQMGHLGTSSSVPSYLRPEQAATPYREDGDDPDGGFILGAFHGDYLPADAPRQFPQSLAPPPTTGFTRVKGGRAHFDAPFSIQAPPDADERRAQRQAPQTHGTQPLPDTYAHISSGRTPNSSQIFHGRTKSQTVVIEDIANLGTPLDNYPVGGGPPSPVLYRAESPLAPPAIPIIHTDDASTDSSVRPRRKFWFAKSASDQHHNDDSDAGNDSDRNEVGLGIWPFRRARNKSEADAAQAQPPTTSEPPPTVRSFQVVRQPRPTQNLSGDAGPSMSKRPATAPDHGDDDLSENSASPQPTRNASWVRRQSSPYG